jgi:hypothetical protein
MYKIIIIAVLIFSGCSKYTMNAAMCDKIASDPHATVPQECRNYVESEAEKAVHKVDKKQSSEDVIEFKKE